MFLDWYFINIGQFCIKVYPTPPSGLDIGYVPAGPHAFFRSSGQFGPQQFILCWPAGPVAFRSVANACRAYQYQFFLLT